MWRAKKRSRQGTGKRDAKRPGTGREGTAAVLAEHSADGAPRGAGRKGGNGTFDFVGFTHYWAKSRTGYWVIKRKTLRKRLGRAMKALWRWCRANMHRPIVEQHRVLCQKLLGHYQYYGLRGNCKALSILYRHVRRAWRYWLNRRDRESNFTWEKLDQPEGKFWLSRPRIIHNF